MIITDMSAAHAASTQIRNTLAEKELLLREVHHRVKNNLQIITSLLRLQARSTHNSQIAEALRDTQNRIRVMALVHEQLYRSSSLAAIEIGDYLRSLGNSVHRSFSDGSAGVRLACDVTATLMLEPDLAIPLGLIVTELLVNSLKHAFPGGRAGLLQLRASHDDDTLVVIVADDGVGFVPPEDPPTTLGLDLVTSLALQIGAHLRIEHQSGTWVELRVPSGRNAGSVQRSP
jgi:two-component sensor histidine kinase